MPRVIHFEVHATDPLRAAKFYQELFGWEISEWTVPGVEVPNENRYWVATTGVGTEAGINGGILFRRGDPPTPGQSVNAYICTIGVLDIDEYLVRANTAGGTIVVPKMPIRGVGWLAYCTDTEGNIFGMLESDAGAV